MLPFFPLKMTQCTMKMFAVLQEDFSVGRCLVEALTRGSKNVQVSGYLY